MGGDEYAVEGARHTGYAFDPAGNDGLEGAGTVHHIAWACRDETVQLEWRRSVLEAGMNVTGVFDRKYFRSIYFREPSGVLFEIATLGPGFAVDERPEELGRRLSLPEWHEHLRDSLQQRLTPIIYPRRKDRREEKEVGDGE